MLGRCFIEVATLKSITAYLHSSISPPEKRKKRKNCTWIIDTLNVLQVENSFRGTTFPVIIADKSICHELRLLEPLINGIAEVGNDTPTNGLESQNTGRSWSREEVLHFLDELGWLFQRKRNSTLLGVPDYKLNRFKFLVIFAMEHDFCALVKTLLDILLELNLGRRGLVTESMKMLWEIHPLNRAVRRRCSRMVDLLVHYSIIDPDDASQKYIFPPNLAGPGGLTPLHLAACASSSEELIDALISDPQEVLQLVCISFFPKVKIIQFLTFDICM